MGVLSLADAIAEAKKRGFDLVEVAPQAEPVVCKFLDFGKYKYRQEKLERKRHKTTQKLKEMRLTSRIDEHDFETKVRRIKHFLEHDDKVKVTIVFRGREIVHVERGRQLMERMIKELQGVGKVDQPPLQRGPSLQMVLVPTRATKEHENNATGREES
jgi:translation initiation factor IF-3